MTAPITFHDGVRDARFDLARNSAFAAEFGDEQIAAIREVDARVASGAYVLAPRPCPLCEGRSFTVIANRDRYAFAHQTVLCDACSFCFTNPVMREQDYRDFYERFYRRVYGGATTATAEFFERKKRKGVRERKFLLKRAPRLDLSAVLDVGCGAGGMLKAFQDQGSSVLGLDHGEDYLAFGRSQGLTLLQGGINDCPKDFAPTLIIYSHVLEHVYEPDKELADLKNRFPHAACYVVCPGLFNMGFFRHDVLMYLQNAHLWNFSEHSMRRLLARHGAHVIHADKNVRALFDFREPPSEVVCPPDSHDEIARLWEVSDMLRGHPTLAAKMTL